ncbi:MAG: carboxypeptidase-like regulatory domain-containing protein, partial [Acidobacteriota bacterium]
MASKSRSWRIALVTGGVVFAGAIGLVGARSQPAAGAAAAAQAAAAGVAIDADDIGGVVTGPRGPEAGVWVIAETRDLPTQFRKIVVTDDMGRYVLPDLPAAAYQVWVRGYGLVDSPHVTAKPGQSLALTAVIAPDAKAAAEIYPANYWYSLMQMPPKEAFPIAVNNGVGTVDHNDIGGLTGERPANTKGGAQLIQTQAQWAGMLKCTACHQVGTKATRSLSKNLGTFESSAKMWERAMQTGQEAGHRIAAIDRFGRERGLAMFADWTDRIAAGEVPAAPPRPQGVERNVVLTLWDISTPVSFIHDSGSTDKRNPSVNAYGPIYGGEWSENALVWVDPVKHTKALVPVPIKDENDRKSMPTWTPQTMKYPSPVWGDEIIWNDPVNAHTPTLDAHGNVWLNVETHHPKKQPAYCKGETNNVFGKNAPIMENGRGVDMFDPKTGKFRMFDTCFHSSHLVFAEDKDDTIYFSIIHGFGGIGWVKTKVLLETGDEEKAQGWCPPILDYNGDGKLGAYTLPNEPPDPTLDRYVRSGGYGVAWSPADNSAWYVSPGTPGFIARMVIGNNPPSTCRTEVYEPPYYDPKMPTVAGSNPRGIDIDRNGVVWTALSDTGHLASFDRRKCKATLTGPKATGKHCAEGWTLYTAPGPKFKGATDQIGSDMFYYNWVDQFDTLGLGKNVPIVTGTWSDSMLALDAATKT